MLKKLTGQYRHHSIMFATLMLFWIMLTGSLTLDVLITGSLASVVIVFLFPDGLSFFTEFRATPEAFRAGLKYYRYFFTELIKSNLRLAAIVLSPELPIDPGIVKVKTTLKSRMGRLMLANSISLTPGTLSVDLVGEYLYIHCVQIESTDIEEATALIVADFETYLKDMYG